MLGTKASAGLILTAVFYDKYYGGPAMAMVDVSEKEIQRLEQLLKNPSRRAAYN